MSAKVPPESKLKPHAVTFSDTEKAEMVRLVNLRKALGESKYSLAEYVRELTKADESHRKLLIAKLESDLKDKRRRNGR